MKFSTGHNLRLRNNLDIKLQLYGLLQVKINLDGSSLKKFAPEKVKRERLWGTNILPEKPAPQEK